MNDTERQVLVTIMAMGKECAAARRIPSYILCRHLVGKALNSLFAQNPFAVGDTLNDNNINAK